MERLIRVEHSILAIELCLRMDGRARLRDELHSLVTSHPATSGSRQKAELLRRLSELLDANDELFEMGCWDFFDDDRRAVHDYQMWCKGMTTEEGARTEPSGVPEKYGEPRFMTFTIALLLLQGSTTERSLAKLCETPEDQLWKKATFLKILRGLASVDFDHVESDVLYLIPGDVTWGLTHADLKLPKFQYLRKIV